MLFVVVFALALLIALVIAFDNALDRGLNLALFLDTLLPLGSVVALHTLTSTCFCSTCDFAWFLG